MWADDGNNLPDPRPALSSCSVLSPEVLSMSEVAAVVAATVPHSPMSSFGLLMVLSPSCTPLSLSTSWLKGGHGPVLGWGNGCVCWCAYETGFQPKDKTVLCLG